MIEDILKAVIAGLILTVITGISHRVYKWWWKKKNPIKWAKSR